MCRRFPGDISRQLMILFGLPSGLYLILLDSCQANMVTNPWNCSETYIIVIITITFPATGLTNFCTGCICSRSVSKKFPWGPNKFPEIFGTSGGISNSRGFPGAVHTLVVPIYHCRSLPIALHISDARPTGCEISVLELLGGPTETNRLPIFLHLLNLWTNINKPSFVFISDVDKEQFCSWAAVEWWL